VYVSSILAVGGSKRPAMHHETSRSSVRLSSYPYARAKLEAEQLCLGAAGRGLPVCIANPAEVYGPNDTASVTATNLINFVVHSPVLVCSGGISIAYLEDVAAGLVTVLEKGRSGERYILSGENVTIRRLAELTLELLGLRKTVMSIPNPLVQALAWLGRNLKVPLPFHPEVIPYATLYWFMDSSKAQQELGLSFRPARATLAPTLKWLSDAGKLDGAR
jgi:dihydroflavonol-4-reductase